MKKLAFIFVIVIGLAFLSLRRASAPSPSADGVASIAYANSVIPEMMGEKPKAQPVQFIQNQTRGRPDVIEFRSFLKNSFDSLPTITQVRAQPGEDFRFTPKAVMGTSETFGAIADRIKGNSSLISEALKFYAKCAKQDSLVNSVRAVCVRNFEDWSAKAGMRVVLKPVPPEIQRIANHLPKHN